MSAHDERHCWDGSDENASFSMNSFGKRMMGHALLPVHVDHPIGGCNSVAEAMPEGDCEVDGQDRTND
jgi:hypothetical protein